MASMTVVTQGPSPEDDYGLDAIAQHNAAQTTEQFPPYQDDTKGLGIYHGAYDQAYLEDQSYLHNPPTPRSNTASDGVRTRSGRSTRRTDSPFGASNARVSKSPASRTKKEKKSKIDKSKMPKLTAPLSVLTKDMETPMKDMDAWVHRSADVRRKEVEKRNGYVTRPMNSFMLYRSAYADRTKHWCLQNNHQVVSSVSGESWPMEPEEVRNQFNEWAKIERANHQAAHPEYKFSPSKPSNKRRKGEFTDDEDDVSELDGDPDGEYRGGGRSVRQRRQQQQQQGYDESAYLSSTVGFDSHPYFTQQGVGYDTSAYAYGNPGRPLPSNVAYDTNGMAYNPQTGTYIQGSMHQQQPQYGYVQDMRGVRVPTPASMNGSQSLGGYGLPGGQAGAEDLFTSSRTATPMQQFNQYGQPVYPQYHNNGTLPQSQYTPQPHHSAAHQAPPQQMYEHAAYLQQASQPQAAIDPGLDAALAAASESHFDDAIGELAAMPEYFEESTSPDQTLAPNWGPADGLN